MGKIKLLMIISAIVALLSITVPGYCPFRNDVDSEQVRAKMVMQREKDENSQRLDEFKKNEMLQNTGAQTEEEIQEAQQSRQGQQGSSNKQKKRDNSNSNVSSQTKYPGQVKASNSFYGFNRNRDTATPVQEIIGKNNIKKEAVLKQRFPGKVVIAVIIGLALAWFFFAKKGSD